MVLESTRWEGKMPSFSEFERINEEAQAQSNNKNNESSSYAKRDDELTDPKMDPNDPNWIKNPDNLPELFKQVGGVPAKNKKTAPKGFVPFNIPGTTRGNGGSGKGALWFIPGLIVGLLAAAGYNTQDPAVVPVSDNDTTTVINIPDDSKNDTVIGDETDTKEDEDESTVVNNQNNINIEQPASNSKNQTYYTKPEDFVELSNQSTVENDAEQTGAVSSSSSDAGKQKHVEKYFRNGNPKKIVDKQTGPKQRNLNLFGKQKSNSNINSDVDLTRGAR